MDTQQHGLAEDLFSLLVRLIWALIGPSVLFLGAALLLRDDRGPWSLTSVLYFGALLTVVALRWLDVRVLRGTTLDNHPATLADFRVYAVWLSLACTTAWVFVHAVR